MSEDYTAVKQLVEGYLSNNKHNATSPFELIFVPANTADFIKNDMGESLDMLLDYNQASKISSTLIETMTVLNGFPVHQFDTAEENTPYASYVLLPLLFEAYNIHAHWLNGMDVQDALELAKLIPLEKDIGNPNGIMTHSEYQSKACDVLESLVAGAMSTSSITAPIYDNVTLSKCGKYVFVPVPMSDYTYPDTGIDAVKIYAKKLMKSILIKANSHHPETQVSNSSLFASYLTSLSLQN